MKRKVHNFAIGQKINHLTVLSRTKRNNVACWECQCDCENKTIIYPQSFDLANNKITSCGCVKKKNMQKVGKNNTGNFKPADIAGLMFNYIEVITFSRTTDGVHYWNCYCNGCNEFKEIEQNSIKYYAKSCGCLKIENAKKLGHARRAKDPKIQSAKKAFEKYSKEGLTFEQFLELSQQPCYICTKLPNESNCCNIYQYKETTYVTDLDSVNYFYNGLDRKDNNLLHTIDNVKPCCKICNSAKLNRTFDNFNDHIINIFNKILNTSELRKLIK